MTYRLTGQGKRLAKSILSANRDGILDTIYGMKTASLDEIVISTGMDKYTVLAELRKLKSKGLVVEEGLG